MYNSATAIYMCMYMYMYVIKIFRILEFYTVKDHNYNYSFSGGCHMQRYFLHLALMLMAWYLSPS